MKRHRVGEEHWENSVLSPVGLQGEGVTAGGADRVGAAQGQRGHGILCVSCALFSLLNSFRLVLSGF